MAHFGFRGEVEELLVDRVFGQRGHRQGRYKASAGLRQDCANRCAALAQAPDELQALVRRNTAADDEKDALAAEVQARLRSKSRELTGLHTELRGKSVV